MATLSETMTLAGFSARVTLGTLNIGQIYTISDKGWVLQAHTNTVAKPLHGALKINNGDILPEGIEPDELWISSGEISVKFDGSEGFPALVITIPVGYYPITALLTSADNPDNISFLDTDDNLIGQTNASVPKCISHIFFPLGLSPTIPPPYFENIPHKIKAISANTDATTIITVFCKIYL